MGGVTKSIIFQALVSLLVGAFNRRVLFVEGFHFSIGLPTTVSNELRHSRSINVVATLHQPRPQKLQYIAALFNERNHDSNDADNDAHSVQSRRRIRNILQSALTSISKGVSFTRKNIRFVVALTIATTILSGNSRFMKIESCSASAPVMAIPKAEGRDPITEALEVQIGRAHV